MTNRFQDAASDDYTIPANDFIEIPLSGEFVRCIESSDAFKMSVDNGSKVYFAAGMSYSPPGAEEFRTVQLFNETGVDIDVTMAIGGGELTDNRLTFTGNMKVVNAAGEKLDVDDADTQAAIAALQTAVEAVETEIQAVTAMMQNALDQRLPLVDLSNATFGESNGATTTTFVTAVQNTNDVVIHSLTLFAGNSSGYGKLLINGSPAISVASVSGASVSIEKSGIRIGAGNSIAITGNGASCGGSIAYEVL